MAQDIGPFDLDRTQLILCPDGTGIAKDVAPDFYENLASHFKPFSGHVLIAQHDCDAPWPAWEMHPKDDEFVYLIHGDVDFVLWIDNEERAVRLQQPGTFIVVPKATWHTVRSRQPSRLLFVTPGEDTQYGEPPRPTPETEPQI